MKQILGFPIEKREIAFPLQLKMEPKKIKNKKNHGRMVDLLSTGKIQTQRKEIPAARHYTTRGLPLPYQVTKYKHQRNGSPSLHFQLHRVQIQRRRLSYDVNKHFQTPLPTEFILPRPWNGVGSVVDPAASKAVKVITKVCVGCKLQYRCLEARCGSFEVQKRGVRRVF
ncbi:hypothetical protein M501DRAFT_588438 [Patellaria atrata CBS 101060]|uniref:Uncharacterized protein n=1 Tax=Patellaria atrata CBS 101060 TaxID=1346257 RepID=A0A9P4S3G3_9PEZI|nr:hypothetical protein M501DRAFT_588438 [Patellaria atrata CBS 101060]